MFGTFSPGTPYTIPTAPSGLIGGGYVLRNNTTYTATIDASSGTSVVLTPSTATPLSKAYWTGGLPGNVSVWAASNGTSASNWAQDDGLAVQALTPGANADVFVSTSLGLVARRFRRSSAPT